MNVPQPQPRIRERRAPLAEEEEQPVAERPVAREDLAPLPRRLAVVCLEPSATPLWDRVTRELEALARRGLEVHLYCSEPVDMADAIRVHAVGAPSKENLVEAAAELGHRVAVEVARGWGPAAGELAVLGYEWRAIPALVRLQAISRSPCVLALESLERQRSDDMEKEVSRTIEEIEQTGLQYVDRLVVGDPVTAEHARLMHPACGERLAHYREVFPMHELAPRLDPGEVKARYQVGPVDPTIVFVGDLDNRHGPDILLAAMPGVLKNCPQARLVIVGDGPLTWTLKVQSRYRHLDYAVRIAGHQGEREVRELVAAADIIAVPSRVRTEDWQIRAGWAARRPVLATHEVAGHLAQHEMEAVLVYANEASIIWGLDRLLFDGELGRAIGERGAQRLDELWGYGSVAAHLEDLLGMARPAS